MSGVGRRAARHADAPAGEPATVAARGQRRYGMTASRAGSYYKRRTKAWLESEGFAVAYLERMMWVRGRGGAVTPIKHDQLGADLLAVRADLGCFVQVKLGRSNIAAAVREFRRYPCPAGLRQWVVVWERGAREPDIIDLQDDVTDG